MYFYSFIVRNFTVPGTPKPSGRVPEKSSRPLMEGKPVFSPKPPSDRSVNQAKEKKR
jgi:hypothetical protein